MNIPSELWDLVKMVFCAYIVYVLNKSDRNMTEIFNRLRDLERRCAAHHGMPGDEK